MTDRATPGGSPQATTAQLFSLEGEYWTIACEGTVFRLRDGKGLRYLAHLLRNPGVEIPARQLLSITAAAGAAVSASSADEKGHPAAERARSTVSKRIRGAVEKIEVYHPGLGSYLRVTIKTGHACSYVPERGPMIRWGR